MTTLTAEVIRGFSYDVIQAASMLEIRLGIAPATPARTKKRFCKGETVRFESRDDYEEFLQLARLYGGEVK